MISSAADPFSRKAQFSSPTDRLYCPDICRMSQMFFPHPIFVTSYIIILSFHSTLHNFATDAPSLQKLKAK